MHKISNKSLKIFLNLKYCISCVLYITSISNLTTVFSCDPSDSDDTKTTRRMTYAEAGSAGLPSSKKVVSTTPNENFLLSVE